MRVAEVLQANAVEDAEKGRFTRRIRSKLRRFVALRTRRSELNRVIFAKSRARALRVAFDSWSTYYRWHFASEATLDAAYNVNKQLLDINRRERELREANERKAHGVARGALPPKAPSLLGGMPAAFRLAGTSGAGELPIVERTAMQIDQRKMRACKMCGARYSQADNNSDACPYHPGVYDVACPKPDHAFLPSCQAHYRKRWSCCDATDAGFAGAGGCRRRWHVQDATDPDYDDGAARCGARVGVGGSAALTRACAPGPQRRSGAREGGERSGRPARGDGGLDGPRARRPDGPAQGHGGREHAGPRHWRARKAAQTSVAWLQSCACVHVCGGVPLCVCRGAPAFRILFVSCVPIRKI